MGSILDHVSFLLNIITAAIIAFQWESTGICQNLLEMVGMCQNLWIPIISSRFQWIPMEAIPGGSRIPTDSSGFHRILLEFPWNWNPKWLRFKPNGFRWNSMEFRWECRNLPELMGECKDLISTNHKWMGFSHPLPKLHRRLVYSPWIPLLHKSLRGLVFQSGSCALLIPCPAFVSIQSLNQESAMNFLNFVMLKPSSILSSVVQPMIQKNAGQLCFTHTSFFHITTPSPCMW